MSAVRTLLRPLLALVAAGSALVLLTAAPASATAAPAVATARTAAPTAVTGAASEARPGLTASQERVVLGLIDDICGDTWCEGDYRFDFRDFGCAPAEGTCTLRLRLSPYTDGVSRWYWRSGRVRGFGSFSVVVAAAQTAPPELIVTSFALESASAMAGAICGSISI